MRPRKHRKMPGFEWINSIVSHIGKFIPRPALCHPTHRAVLITNMPFRAPRIRELHPGMHFYWPLVQSYEQYPVVRQVVNLPVQAIQPARPAVRQVLPVQAIQPADPEVRPYFVSAFLVVRVNDVVKAMTETFELDDTIREVGQSAVARLVAEHTPADLHRLHSDGQLDELLREAADEILDDFGIDVLSASFTDLTPHTVIRCEGSAYVNAADDDE